MQNKELAFLAGLPRTGSTLLASILYQNPNIHTGGNSPVCPIMLGLSETCWAGARQQIFANNAQQKAIDLIKSVPQSYYSDVDRPIIVDKCRAWTCRVNFDLITTYITQQPKFIVMVRPIQEILLSFGHLRMKNPYPNAFGKSWQGDPFSDLLDEQNRQLILSPAEGVIYAKENYPDNCIFVSYNDLVNSTRETLQSIYAFFGWDWFDHDLENIVNQNQENDVICGLEGLHDVRPQIAKQEITLKLPQYLADAAQEINEKIGINYEH